jgi:alkylation response protein AidB-like acyl-CoA dehydrogenase
MTAVALNTGADSLAEPTSATLTIEQTSLQAATRELFAARAGQEARRAHTDEARPYDAELWNVMASELGLHGILIDDRYGGAGGSLVDLAVVLEEAGAALLCAPFFATVVMAATAIAESGDDAAQAKMLPAIAAGELVATLAYREPADEPGEMLTALQRADTWTVSGSAVHVIDGDSAQVYLVVARTSAGQGLFAVRAEEAGVDCANVPALDLTRRLATLRLQDAQATLIGGDGAGVQTLQRTLGLARVALSAEQVGAAQRCLDMSVDYVQNRRQFGRAIGSFQAVKHRCSDMFVDVTSARAVTLNAAWAATGDPDNFDRISHATSALVSDAFMRTATQTIQVHGGIGYTWEHDAHLYLRRAISSAQLLGTAAEHREHLASAIGL